MTSTATKNEELPLDLKIRITNMQVRITNKFGEVRNSYDSFILARALYIGEARLNGKDDVTIAREITVEYRDSGAHVRQIRESLGIE